MPIIRLSWNANPEPDINGYKLYAGTATNSYLAVGSPKTFGVVTTGTFDITVDGNWFFVLTATNTSGFESAPSTPEITGRFLTAKSTVRQA